ncbi:MAG: hypothetical protein LC793_15825 [Thermomicrobia bacterium]|nr:hypothetical protein [Thermomicrobia bacterium]MCA1724526.1 hypothetical protein [Thermomicrobia bacterium]
MGDGTFDTETVIDDADFAPGARVRIRGKPVGVTLETTTGTIIEADEWDGYYRIHLDVPALYHCADGHTELLQDIREAGDNLTVLSPSAA